MVKLKKDDKVVYLSTKGAVDAFVSNGWEVVESSKKKVDVKDETDKAGDKVEVKKPVAKKG